MFGRRYSKKLKNMEALNTPRVDIDIPDIESESIKLNKDLDTRDDLYKLDDFFAYDDEEYVQIASGEVTDVIGRVMPKSLKLRKDIGSDGEVLEILEHAEEVYIVKAFNGWYYIKTSRETFGWCMCCHIDTNINGFNREMEAASRNKYIEDTLESTKNGLVKADDEPTKIRSGLFSVFTK